MRLRQAARRPTPCRWMVMGRRPMQDTRQTLGAERCPQHNQLAGHERAAGRAPAQQDGLLLSRETRPASCSSMSAARAAHLPGALAAAD